MKRRRSLIALVQWALLLGTLAWPLGRPATAQDCHQQTPEKVPVVLVHGFSLVPGLLEGEPESMEPIERDLCEIPGLYVYNFAYTKSAAHWVTDDDIGPALAGLIGRLADASARGKVIVIGHSMGGLAARAAAGSVGDQIGLAITIGTPHRGSLAAAAAVEIVPPNVKVATRLALAACSQPLASWRPEWFRRICDHITNLAIPAMDPRSSELANLPHFENTLPPDAPVLTIAGRYLGVSLNWFGEPRVVGGLGDLVVGAKSASAEARGISANGGAKFVDCAKVDLMRIFTDRSADPSPRLLDCWHGDLPKKAPVIRYVADSVERWLADHPLPPTPADEDGEEAPPTSEPPSDPSDLLEDFAEEWSATSARITYSVSFDSPYWVDEGTLVLAWRPPDAFRMDYDWDVLGGTVILIAVRGEGMYLCLGSGPEGSCEAIPWGDLPAEDQLAFADLFSGPEVLLQEIESTVGEAAIQVSPRTIAGLSATCFAADIAGATGSEHAEWCFSDNGILLSLAASNPGIGAYAQMEATQVTGVSDAAFQLPFPVS